MTVDELIVKLKEMSERGHGTLPAVIWEYAWGDGSEEEIERLDLEKSDTGYGPDGYDPSRQVVYLRRKGRF